MRNMIHRNQQALQLPSWKTELVEAIKSPSELLNALDLPFENLEKLQKAHKLFPIRVPRSFVNKMEKGNIHDPLLRQVLSSADELVSTTAYTTDPVGDLAAEKAPGLIHKYQGRVLLTVTGACGIHCRYCFRRHFDYRASNPTQKNWQKCIDYIKNDHSIFEVILSGGDPLSLNDAKLTLIVEELSRISHIKILRIHTRQIIVIPSRVDKNLLEWVSNTRLKCIFVVHCNHAAEIDTTTTKVLQQLKSVGVGLLNQSVLLKGVNDHPEILKELSMTLFEAGVLPYYLHMLDKVKAASHFDVHDKKALEIYENLTQMLPGYLVPKLVREIKGMASKTSLSQ